MPQKENKSFEGKVIDVKLEICCLDKKDRISNEGINKFRYGKGNAPRGTQFHIIIKPKDKPFGLYHEWIRLSSIASKTLIPQGSVVDRYIQFLEMVDVSFKNKKTILQVFKHMKHKSFVFRMMPVGKLYEGHDARYYAVPLTLIGGKSKCKKKK